MVSRGDHRGARVGEQRRDLVGDPLDAGAAGDEAVLLAAFGAGLGRRHDVAAMVAGEAVHQPVLDHPGGAVGALEAVAAVAAQGQRAKPRRLRNSSDLLAARRDWPRARRPGVGASQRPRGGGSWVRSMARIVGHGGAGEAAAAASLRGSGRSRPCAGSRSPGVAEARITGMSSNWPRITATSRAWYWTPSSCLKLGSCASSTTIRPRLRIGQEQRRAGADHDLRLAGGDRAPGAAALRRAQVASARRPARSRSGRRSGSGTARSARFRAAGRAPAGPVRSASAIASK